MTLLVVRGLLLDVFSVHRVAILAHERRILAHSLKCPLEWCQTSPSLLVSGETVRIERVCL